LTLTAAEQAGFPNTVRLLEEPQAAFYCWLEQHDLTRDLWGEPPHKLAGARHLLVIDIGGGTSDFSLFELRLDDQAPLPHIKRVAVSDHILLGGDNVDLAIARLVEQRMLGEHGRLSGAQWGDLVARCRDVKETALSSGDQPQQSFLVSLPGRGSSPIAGLQVIRLTRAEIEGALLEGFFPECDANARPYRIQVALRRRRRSSMLMSTQKDVGEFVLRCWRKWLGWAADVVSRSRHDRNLVLIR
jgi:molecular chaperone DnaK (HSP70)